MSDNERSVVRATVEDCMEAVCANTGIQAAPKQPTKLVPANSAYFLPSGPLGETPINIPTPRSVGSIQRSVMVVRFSYLSDR